MIMPDPRAQVAAAFNRVAAGYDNPASRFFPFCADRLMLAIRKRVLLGQLMGKDRGHE